MIFGDDFETILLDNSRLWQFFHSDHFEKRESWVKASLLQMLINANPTVYASANTNARISAATDFDDTFVDPFDAEEIFGRVHPRYHGD